MSISGKYRRYIPDLEVWAVVGPDGENNVCKEPSAEHIKTTS